jgi:oligoribonuclease (3'-5' exoribonuclease)
MISKKLINDVLLKYANRYISSGMGKNKYLQSPEQLTSVFRGKKLLVFDTETTGLFGHIHQITEIAAEVIDGDSFEVLDSFHRKVTLTEKTLARLKCEKEVSSKDPKFFGVEKCLTMNGYNPDDPDLKELDQVLIDFYEFCEKHNAIIVGQNATFDLQMVNTALKKIMPRTQVKNQGVYDTKVFFSTFVIPALQALKARGDEDTKNIIEAIWDPEKNRPSSRLGLILKAFGIDIVGWHGAPADVKSTVMALKKIMEFIRDHSDIATDPVFLKERAKAFHKEVGEYKDRDKKQRRDFYHKDKL